MGRGSRIPKKVMQGISGKVWSAYPLKKYPDILPAQPNFPLKPVPFTSAPWHRKKQRRTAITMKAVHPQLIPPVTPYKEWPIVRGDTVEVLVGADTGKQGKVRVVARSKNQLKVEGLNLREKHIPDAGDGKPAHMCIEDPLHYTEVKLVDPTTGRGTDVEFRYTETGERVRVCVHSERVIPKPVFEHKYYKSTRNIPTGPLDTKEDVASAHTHIPSMLLFHEEIMLEMGIPMSVPKGGPERRDMVMKEIEEDEMTRRDDELGLEAVLEDSQESSSSDGLLSSVKSYITPWRK